MSSCLGFRKQRSDDREPLLPQYEDDTALQRELHQKLHSYQMLRAIGQGYMPTNEQLILNLRTLIASDILSQNNPDLSQSGRRLVKFTKQWLKQFSNLLQHKNDDDQVQDLIWSLSKARVSIDASSISRRASMAKAHADAKAAYESVRTVGSLLLTNSDVRILLSDLATVGREVFKDTAVSVSKVAEEAGERVAPTANQLAIIDAPDTARDAAAPTTHELGEEVVEVSKVLGSGAAQVASDAKTSATEHLSGDTREALVSRLARAVGQLRKRPDYSESVSIISKLIQRYALIYSNSINDATTTVQQEVEVNPELDQAAKSFWALLSSFGDPSEWKSLEKCYYNVMKHQERDPEFEKLMIESSEAIQDVLTDPDFLRDADGKLSKLQSRAQQVGSDSPLRQDVSDLLQHMQMTSQSLLRDEDVLALIDTSTEILHIISPTDATTNADLIQDAINVFTPLAIQAVQHVPIPRLEISVPEIDLLLENLIVEPGETVNGTSFLPFRLRAETFNDLEIRRTRTHKTATSSTSLVTLKADGLSVRADEVGYWFKLHKGIFRLNDSGIASFALDERGMDVHLDVALNGPSNLESMIKLTAVRVHIHKMSYTLRQSKFAFLAWLLKPIIRPILRRTLEKQIATAIADFFHAVNREVVFARERLRATRISDPKDIVTFAKAVLSRLTPADDPDMYSRVGLAPPHKGVFKDVYAPGSLVKLWEEEALRATEVIEDAAFNSRGWKNQVFDVVV